MSNNKNFITSLIFTLAKIPGIVFVVLAFAFVIFVSMGGRLRDTYPSYPRERSCYGNMRVVLGAFEMYNMDHKAFDKAYG